MKKFVVLIFVVLAFLLVQPKIIHADDPTNEVKINIQNDLSSNLEIDFNLKDQTNINFLTGFNLTLPFDITGNITGTLKDQALNVSNQSADDKSTLSFSTASMDLSLDTWLKLKFQSQDLVKAKFGINYLYLPQITNNFGLGNLLFDVVYPASFKKIAFISAANPTYTSDTEFSASTDKSLYAIWGNDAAFNLSFGFTLKNTTSSETAPLVNLPANLNQDVVYSSFPNVDGGLYDSSENNFGVKDLQANQNADISYGATITLNKNSGSTAPVLPQYDWTLNTGSTFSKNLLTKLQNLTSSKEKIQMIDQYLVENLDPYLSEKYDLTQLNGVWDKLNGTSQYNSIEYCYLAISAANYLGYKGNLAYGYLLLPDLLLNEKRSPHVWCEINDGSQTYFLDPFLEDQFKVDFNLTEPPDRVLFGRWSPDMETYNNILGLTSNDADEQQADITNTTSKPDSNNKIDITLSPQPGDLYSGDFYAADLDLNNNSKYFLQLKGVSINNIPYLSTLAIQTFYPALIPQKDTSFSFSNLIEPNILFTGSENIISKIQVDNANFDASNLSGSKNLFFRIDIGNILKELIIVAGIALLIYIGVKYFIKRRAKTILNKHSKGNNRRAKRQANSTDDEPGINMKNKK